METLFVKRHPKGGSCGPKIPHQMHQKCNSYTPCEVPERCLLPPLSAAASCSALFPAAFRKQQQWHCCCSLLLLLLTGDVRCCLPLCLLLLKFLGWQLRLWHWLKSYLNPRNYTIILGGSEPSSWAREREKPGCSLLEVRMRRRRS